ILSPFTGGWLRLQCKGTIQIVNGCFQLTKIGVFRLTRNGDYRLTLTIVCIIIVFAVLYLELTMPTWKEIYYSVYG
ncbi:hypothetical protein, partial [Dysosmobacter sp.]|uniref:hypothetical protein n=1 Tax=Dysosmobacter sp. TaxID=2591382 RepID=UPI003AB63B8E